MADGSARAQVDRSFIEKFGVMGQASGLPQPRPQMRGPGTLTAAVGHGIVSGKTPLHRFLDHPGCGPVVAPLFKKPDMQAITVRGAVGSRSKSQGTLVRGVWRVRIGTGNSASSPRSQSTSASRARCARRLLRIRLDQRPSRRLRDPAWER